MPKIIIKSLAHKIVDVEEGQTLLSAIRQAGIGIKSSCNGHASCGQCVVKFIQGLDHATGPTFEEMKIIGNVAHITKERLACQTKIQNKVIDDVIIDFEEDTVFGSQPRAQNIKTQVRNKVDVKKIVDERNENKDIKQKERDSKDQQWFKHWERPKTDDDKNQKKSSGHGGKTRPKFFQIDSLDEQNEKDEQDDKKFEKKDSE